jgi:hypothetical protein
VKPVAKQTEDEYEDDDVEEVDISAVIISNSYSSYEKIKANRRTAEYRILNVEGWIRFAQSFIK